MTNKNGNNILWTATDLTLPEVLWSRLEGNGYGVLVADDNEQALSKIKKVSPRLWVGQIDGEPEPELSLLRDVRSEFPELPIILASKRPSIEEAVLAIKLGATDYIKTGISQEQLWVILDGVLKYPGNIQGSQTRKPLKPDPIEPPVAVHHAMLNLLKTAEKIAPRRSSVLIQGESGTGKEVIARYIHKNSDRRSGPFIGVNCAALPETLLESELFGHERGAFTGAVTRKKGKFELADGGTLLLDEISEMALSIQAKLLRVLQEREIDRVGGQFSIPVDVRIVATTNRDLEKETKKGNFRIDLFYRLNVVPLKLPPLRNRPDDIVPLAEFFLKKHCCFNHIEAKSLSPEAEDFLRQRNWPGNVRELENLMERATLLVDPEVIQVQDLELISNAEDHTECQHVGNNQILSLRELEKRAILQALNVRNGNRTHAAKVLGISVRTLRNKLHEYEKELDMEGIKSDD